MSYIEDSAQAAAEIAREYYDDQPPSKGAPAAFPTFPAEDDPEYPEDLPCEYIELVMPGGGSFLAILTLIPVRGGPGAKYRAELIG